MYTIAGGASGAASASVSAISSAVLQHLCNEQISPILFNDNGG